MIDDVQLAGTGDEMAFERLLMSYTPLINSLVSMFIKSYPSFITSEDDLRQESAIALYSAVLSYKERDGVSFGLYAKVCIKNRLVSYMRRMIASVLTEQISDSIDGVYDNEEDGDMTGRPLDALLLKEGVNALQRRIRERLSESEYTVFSMYADGVAIKTIAEKTGKTVKAVYGTLSRARAKLKDLT